METIHLKSADSVSQAMLRDAALRGVELGWERSEKLQPQDGFLRLGLSCPLDCLHGPCRIDPFGRGPDRGICGLDGDSMVAATLHRLCHRGLLEACAAASTYGTDPEPRFPGKLQDLANKVLTTHGLSPLSENSLLNTVFRPHHGSIHYADLLLQSLHMSLLSLGLLDNPGSGESSASRPCRIGYGVIGGDTACIGLCGNPPPEQVRALGEAQQEAVQLVALGDWIPADDRYVPLACSSGSSELLLSSGAVHVVIAGPDTDPAIFQLCRKLDIPIHTMPLESSAEKILQIAKSCRNRSSRLDMLSDVPPAREFQVHGSGEFLSDLVERVQGSRVGLVSGSDTPQMTLGNLPQQLYGALSADGMILGGWGDASWWIMNNEQDHSFVAFDPLTGPVASVQGLVEADKLGRLTGICFTGLKSCREFAAALGLAFLGCRVSIAVPIPILGSRAVCHTLDEKLHMSGGELTYFDHPADAQELTAWFANQ